MTESQPLQYPAARFVKGSADADASRQPTPTQPLQMSIEDAIAAGQEGMAQATDAAERKDPDFVAKAERAMVDHLSTRPDRSAWGEDLTDIARAHGCRPSDDRAFGAVFQSLARRGVIRCVEFGVRRKGRGTAGARRWALCL